MPKKVTTSAQKTVPLGKAEILERLTAAMSEREGLRFAPTGNPDIVRASAADGTHVSVAAFVKESGQGLAMIDHEGIDEDQRARWQQHWRRVIDAVFADPAEPR